MTRNQLAKLGRASVLVVGGLALVKPVSAGSIELKELGAPISGITKASGSKVDSTEVAMFIPTDAFLRPISKAGDDIAGLSSGELTAGEAARRIGERPVAAAAAVGSAGPGVADLRGPVRFADVPIPPAILLLISAVLGLVTVARRDSAGN